MNAQRMAQPSIRAFAAASPALLPQRMADKEDDDEHENDSMDDGGDMIYDGDDDLDEANEMNIESRSPDQNQAVTKEPPVRVYIDHVLYSISHDRHS
jgi:hypothetical protein